MADGKNFNNCPHVSGVKARLKNLERDMKDQAELLREGQKLFEKVDRRILWLTFAVMFLGSVSVGSTLAVNGTGAAILKLLVGAALP